MRNLILTMALLIPGLGAASSSHGQTDWAERAIEYGISSAELTLRYSLTDNCDLRNVEVIENTHPDIFDTAQISAIVKRVLGPFESEENNLELRGYDSGFRVENVKTIRRVLAWRTTQGHNWIVCYLNGAGELDRAKRTDGHGPPAKVVEDTIINKELSLLGSNELAITFTIED